MADCNCHIPAHLDDESFGIRVKLCQEMNTISMKANPVDGIVVPDIDDILDEDFGDLAFKDSASASYKPAGTISKPNVTVTETKKSINSVNSVGALPTLNMAVNNGNLAISWNAGAIPTVESSNVLTGVTAGLAAAPTFTGTTATITVT